MPVDAIARKRARRRLGEPLRPRLELGRSEVAGFDDFDGAPATRLERAQFAKHLVVCQRREPLEGRDQPVRQRLVGLRFGRDARVQHARQRGRLAVRDVPPVHHASVLRSSERDVEQPEVLGLSLPLSDLLVRRLRGRGRGDSNVEGPRRRLAAPVRRRVFVKRQIPYLPKVWLEERAIPKVRAPNDGVLETLAGVDRNDFDGVRVGLEPKLLFIRRLAPVLGALAFQPRGERGRRHLASRFCRVRQLREVHQVRHDALAARKLQHARRNVRLLEYLPQRAHEALLAPEERPPAELAQPRVPLAVRRLEELQRALAKERGRPERLRRRLLGRSEQRVEQPLENHRLGGLEYLPRAGDDGWHVALLQRGVDVSGFRVLADDDGDVSRLHSAWALSSLVNERRVGVQEFGDIFCDVAGKTRTRHGLTDRRDRPVLFRFDLAEFARKELQLQRRARTTRQYEPRFGVTFGRVDFDVVDAVLGEHAVLIEQAVDRFDVVTIGAPVRAHRKRRVFGVLLRAHVRKNVGAAKPIDRLLRIADEIEKCISSERLPKYPPLDRIGILKFVDERRLKAFANRIAKHVAGFDFAQSLIERPQEIVEREDIALPLSRRQLRHHVVGEAHTKKICGAAHDVFAELKEPHQARRAGRVQIIRRAVRKAIEVRHFSLYVVFRQEPRREVLRELDTLVQHFLLLGVFRKPFVERIRLLLRLRAVVELRALERVQPSGGDQRRRRDGGHPALPLGDERRPRVEPHLLGLRVQFRVAQRARASPNQLDVRIRLNRAGNQQQVLPRQLRGIR